MGRNMKSPEVASSTQEGQGQGQEAGKGEGKKYKNEQAPKGQEHDQEGQGHEQELDPVAGQYDQDRSPPLPLRIDQPEGRSVSLRSHIDFTSVSLRSL